MNRRDKIVQARRCQPVNELRRKAEKAIRRKQKLWTVEELDLVVAETHETIQRIHYDLVVRGFHG